MSDVEQPDYPTAAHAWLSLALTTEAMRLNQRLYAIVLEFADRLAAEQNTDTNTSPSE